MLQAGYPIQVVTIVAKRTDATLLVLFRLERILEECDVATTEARPEETPEGKRLLAVLRRAMNHCELMQAPGLKDAEHFRRHYLKPALESSWLEMTQPQSPRLPTQRYRLAPYVRA